MFTKKTYNAVTLKKIMLKCMCNSLRNMNTKLKANKKKGTVISCSVTAKDTLTVAIPCGSGKKLLFIYLQLRYASYIRLCAMW